MHLDNGILRIRALKNYNSSLSEAPRNDQDIGDIGCCFEKNKPMACSRFGKKVSWTTWEETQLGVTWCYDCYDCFLQRILDGSGKVKSVLCSSRLSITFFECRISCITGKHISW